MNILQTALLVVCLIFLGCDSPIIRPKPESKKIAAKMSPVTIKDSRFPPMTVYYLVAEDGNCVEVSMIECALTPIGTNYTSDKWTRTLTFQ